MVRGRTAPGCPVEWVLVASRDVRSCDEATSAHSTPPRSADRATGSPVATTHGTEGACRQNARPVEPVETTRPGPEVSDEVRDFSCTQGKRPVSGPELPVVPG